MTLIQTITVGSGGAASVEFASIPQIYTDVVIAGSSRSAVSAAQSGILLYLNNNGANIYSQRNLDGDGSTTGSNSTSSTSGFNFPAPGNTATANTFGSITIYIPNYAGATNKSISVDAVSENNVTASNQRISAALFASTTAISSIQLLFSGFNIVQNSSFSLYGILKGSGGATVS